MKNKFLALAAFGAAALGGAIVSAPANAQIPAGQGPESSITVNVSVPEVLYLRTIQNIDLAIDSNDLIGANTLIPVGTPPVALIGPDNNQAEDALTGGVDTTSPFAGGFADGVDVEKTISAAYIVWSNSPTGNYQVQVTAPPTGLVPPAPATGSVSVTVVEAATGNTNNPATVNAQGLVTSTAQDIKLGLTASTANIAPGTYTGNLTVEAFRP